jgi:hypothetical protein
MMDDSASEISDNDIDVLSMTSDTSVLFADLSPKPNSNFWSSARNRFFGGPNGAISPGMVPRTDWIPDGDAKLCVVCKAKFNILNRRVGGGGGGLTSAASLSLLRPCCVREVQQVSDPAAAAGAGGGAAADADCAGVRDVLRRQEEVAGDPQVAARGGAELLTRPLREGLRRPVLMTLCNERSVHVSHLVNQGQGQINQGQVKVKSELPQMV